jgi:metal-dependent hydrolase (beta-lactamase superfamily II)
VRFLAQELAFHGDSGTSDPDSGARQCMDFLCQHGAEHLVERKEDDVRFLTGKAGPLFENARAAAFRSVDIKGQI